MNKNGENYEHNELVQEDVPTVNIGSGEIAGGGYNGKDDIKVSRKAQRKYKQKSKEGAGRKVLGFKAFYSGKG